MIVGTNAGKGISTLTRQLFGYFSCLYLNEKDLNFGNTEAVVSQVKRAFSR